MGDRVFLYNRCKICGVIYNASDLIDINNYYPSDYAAYSEDSAVDAVDKNKLEIIKQQLGTTDYSGLSLLEIGPGNGNFLDLAKKAGFIVSGLELSRECCEIMKKRGINAIHCTSPSIEIEKLTGTFDIIALYHTVEHLADAFDVLEKVANKTLKPGGLLIISTVDPLCLQAKLFRGSWVYMDVPRHVTLIPEKTLSQFLVNFSLRRIYSTSDDNQSRITNIAGWRFSMALLFSRFRLGKLGLYLGQIIGPLLKIVEHKWYPTAYCSVYQKNVIS